MNSKPQDCSNIELEMRVALENEVKCWKFIARGMESGAFPDIKTGWDEWHDKYGDIDCLIKYD
jgi:hypothetical protein